MGIVYIASDNNFVRGLIRSLRLERRSVVISAHRAFPHPTGIFRRLILIAIFFFNITSVLVLNHRKTYWPVILEEYIGPILRKTVEFGRYLIKLVCLPVPPIKIYEIKVNVNFPNGLSLNTVST